MNAYIQVQKTFQMLLISIIAATSLAIQSPSATLSQAGRSLVQETSINLPLVMKPCEIPPIPNGDFEMGLSDWKVGGRYVDPRGIIRDDFSNPHGGSWVAALRAGFVAVPEETWASIEQNITVPSCTPYLAYWYWEEAVDVWCPGRCLWAIVSVNEAPVRSHYLDHDSTKWEKDVIDLTDYAGQLVALQFLVQGNFYSYPSFVVDDVAFQSKPSP